MRKTLIILTITTSCFAAAHAERVRFACTNTVGAPDLVEVDFGKHTVLEYNKQDDGSITVGSGETPMPATIDKNWIRWPDSLDGTKYTIKRSTGVLKKLFEGGALYTKQCRTVSGTDWR